MSHPKDNFLKHISQNVTILSSFLTFDFFHICTSVRYCSIPVDSKHQYQIWMVRACQGFGAQHDVASCRKRESRGEAKQDIFRSVRGTAPLLLSALEGKCTKGSALTLLLSPPFALTLLFSPRDMFSLLILFFSSSCESNSDGCHLSWSLVVTSPL